MNAKGPELPSYIREQGGYMVIANHFQQPDNYSIKRSEGMGDWLITYTIAGEGYFLIDGEERFCQTGDVTLMHPGVPHQYGTRKGSNWNFVWAHFTPRFMETSLLPSERLLIHAIDSNVARNRIHQAFNRLISDSIERSLYWNELCESTMREILLLLAQRLSKQVDPRIDEIRHLLSTRMQDPIRIDELARAVGLSPSRLSHLYKESTGSSIVDSLNDMRIRQAALLLEHTDRQASEVALDVGFQNYNHFAGQFRKRYGMNPRAYKNREL
ncbi:helix-turn-helix domain-containing protein [Paenibacillus sp. CF384]|uniref:helix-turn-helix domain-containing protein n=1 Tax=Paenibacillus sp. CF384 TaxID=1884382 RepID=UPI000896E53F|nr:helix-turn-helix domain-containing protein [Paenibacillus sp. CF384]SDX38565.1 AraC family transcriptional regulator, arabinose operon regulatory protein [Paenibacillus sp. CF384]